MQLFLQLNAISEQKFASPNERCLVFPSSKIAIAGRAFMNDQAAKKLTPPAPLTPPIPIRIVQFVICPPDNPSSTEPIPQSSCIELHILLFPAEAYPLAKLFWQHVGNGISSRLAERCLLILAARGDGSVKNNNGTAPVAVAVRPTSPQLGRYASAKSRYSQQIKLPSEAIPIPINPQSPSTPEENLSTDQNIYVEERYGRNLPLASADIAKRALKRRIAGVLLRNSDPVQHLGEAQDVIPGESLRGVPGVSEKDVYLFPSGMSAIWSAHQLVMSARPELKSVCFGYVRSIGVVQSRDLSLLTFKIIFLKLGIRMATHSRF
jgi:cystathionine gamma-synthase